MRHRKEKRGRAELCNAVFWQGARVCMPRIAPCSVLQYPPRKRREHNHNLSTVILPAAADQSLRVSRDTSRKWRLASRMRVVRSSVRMYVVDVCTRRVIIILHREWLACPTTPNQLYFTVPRCVVRSRCVSSAAADNLHASYKELNGGSCPHTRAVRDAAYLECRFSQHPQHKLRFCLNLTFSSTLLRARRHAGLKVFSVTLAEM